MFAVLRETIAAFFEDTKSVLVLLSLLGFDLLFIVLYLVHDVAKHLDGYDGLALSYRFDLGVEFGIPEIFNYFQIAVLCYFLMSVYRLTHAKIYLAWGVSYLFVFLDDSLAIHEALGRALAGDVASAASAGFRSQDVGELFAFGLFGIVIGSLLVIGFVRSDSYHRRIGIMVGGLFGLLVFFGVVVDALHRLAASGDRMLEMAMRIVEDGGEMVSISSSCAFAFFLRRKFRSADGASARE